MITKTYFPIIKIKRIPKKLIVGIFSHKNPINYKTITIPIEKVMVSKVVICLKSNLFWKI